MLAGLLVVAQAVGQDAAPPGSGIPEALARQRAAAIADLRYDLTFTIPSEPTAPVRGRAIVRFTLKAPGRVVLDFAQPRDRILGVSSAGAAVSYAHENGHVVVPDGVHARGRQRDRRRLRRG